MRDGNVTRVGVQLYALRESVEAIRLANDALRRKSSRKGQHFQPRTLELAESVILSIIFLSEAFPAALARRTGLRVAAWSDEVVPPDLELLRLVDLVTVGKTVEIVERFKVTS